MLPNVVSEIFPTSLIKKHKKHQICIMDFVSHREITLILIDRSAIRLICVYDVYVGVPFHSI